MSDMTRRNFIGASGAATGMAFASSIHGKAHGDSGKIRLGVIGTGARGQQHIRESLWGSKDFEIVAVADPYTPHLKSGMQYGWVANAGMTIAMGDRPTSEQLLTLKGFTKPTAHTSHVDMLAKQHLDAVLIATPPHTHANIIADCLKAGLHVFCETPMATTIADARDLVVTTHQSDLVVQIGHQRRYHPNYNLAVGPDYRESGLGRVVRVNIHDHVSSDLRVGLPAGTLNAALPPAEDPERYLNWRLYSQPNGGPCMHALPGSIDTANWFCATLPSRVYTSGGTNYWRDGRDTPDNLSAVFDYVIKKGSAGFTPIDCRSEFQDLFQLMKTYTVRCNYSYSLTSTRLGVYDHIMGDQAALALSPSEPCRFTREPWTGIWTEPRLNYTQEEQEAITKRYKALIANMSSEEVLKIRFTRGSSFNGPPEFAPHRRPLEGDFAALGSEESAEVHQFRAFAEHIRNDGTPRANVMVGLAAVIAGESARRSYETGQPVDIDPALMDFDFETPSISLYDTNAAPIPGTTELM